MNNRNNTMLEMHNTQGEEKIKKLEEKIDTTKYNIEISSEIIAAAPSDSQREKLIEKNTQRKHAVSSMKKEIRDIEQTMGERSREIS